MTKNDLPAVRRLANTKAIHYTGHALNQMLQRGITTDGIEEVLCSNTNQLVEVQSKSNTPGKQHRNDRFLIYDPQHIQDIILVCVIINMPLPAISIITAEYPDPQKWVKTPGGDPAIVRIK